MKIFYKGGRNHYEVSYERKSYHFTPENNHILDIQDQKVINYIFSLPNRAEFEAVMEEPKVKVETSLPIITEPKVEVKKPIIKKIKKSKKKRGGR